MKSKITSFIMAVSMLLSIPSCDSLNINQDGLIRGATNALAILEANGQVKPDQAAVIRIALAAAKGGKIDAETLQAALAILAQTNPEYAMYAAIITGFLSEAEPVVETSETPPLS